MSTPPTSRSSIRPRILVVDDDERLRHMLSLLLRNALPGSQVETAEDGLAAQASIPRFSPHLIVTDLAMPNLDGVGLCRWVKSNGFAGTKVLVFTGEPDNRRLAQALEAGADSWLAKPPTVMELLSRVEQLLEDVPPGQEQGHCGAPQHSEGSRRGGEE